MSLFFGIDFGTTTTAFVSYDDETEKPKGFGDRQHPFPSIIVLDSIDGTVSAIGLRARERLTAFEIDDNFIAIRSVKQALQSDMVWRTNTKTWNPQMLVAEILKYGKKKIEKRYPDLDQPISAVMAVPVDFGYEERRYLQTSAQEVGIVVEHFISEPTAAWIGSNNNSANLHNNVVVFDWGGGTLDVSVLKINNNKITELSKVGKRIGGDNIDDLLARQVYNKHRSNHNNVSPFEDISAVQKDKLLIECEQKKIILSKKEESDIFIPSFTGDESLECPVTRKGFEKTIKEKIQSALEAVESAISAAKLSREEIDKVIMVGGSSNIPLIRREMVNIFGAKCIFPNKPGWLIAKGAAIISSRPGGYVLSKSIGIVLSDNTFLPVIIKGKKIDHEEKVITLGLVEDSREARIIIAESFSDKIIQGEYQIIDALTLTVPTTGYHFEPVEVSFQVQKDLALSVTAYGKFNGNEPVVSKIYPHLKFEYEVA